MNSFERFGDIKLPNQQDFYRTLNNKDFEHALKILNEFEIKTMEENQNLHLKTDFLLLADAFEEFRNICIEYYRLHPCHYFSSPGLS